MYIRMPTAREMEECEHIELTSDEPWDPTDVDWEENEEKFTRKYRHAQNAVSSINQEDEGMNTSNPMEQAIIDDMMSDLPKVRMARYATRDLRMGKRAKHVDYDRLRRIFGGVSEETVNKTLAATTHMVQRSGVMPLHKRYKAKFEQLRYQRLKCTLYSDTFFSNVTSTRGNNKTQGFVCGDAFYVMHYPMRSESHAAQGLKDFVRYPRPSAHRLRKSKL